MIATPQPQAMTVDAYFAWEAAQEIRHEYVNGEVFAMTGGTLPHNDLALNLYTALRPHLKQKGCRVNAIDAKVQVTRTIYRYPDLVVSCDDLDKTALKTIQHPKLIAEVLSPSTEAMDRGKKFKEYRTLLSLEEYVLIDAEEMRVEIFRRGEGRMWLYFAYGTGDTLRFESLDFECAIAQIYEAVPLTAAESDTVEPS